MYNVKNQPPAPMEYFRRLFSFRPIEKSPGSSTATPAYNKRKLSSEDDDSRGSDPIETPTSSSPANNSTRKRTYFAPKVYDAGSLKQVCSENTGVCIAFGGAAAKHLRTHFGNFVDTRFILNRNDTSSPHRIKKIGSNSVNGFVIEIPYYRDGLYAYALLKSSAKPNKKYVPDNLANEYLVGMFLNTAGTFFPCFVETYAWFKYSEASYMTMLAWTKSSMANKNKKKAGILHRLNAEGIFGVPNDGCLLEKQPDVIDETHFSDICGNSSLIAILVQHISDARTLKRCVVQSTHTDGFCDKDLLYILYQIYLPLMVMVDDFTHYDLHLENVLVYQPIKNAYIHFRYHINATKIVEFYSPYVVKLIDYGRCFFQAPPATDDVASSSSSSSSSISNRGIRSSVDVLTILKKTPPCKYSGLEGKFSGGFACYDDPDHDTTTGKKMVFHGVQCSQRNKSHDLLVCSLLKSDHSTKMGVGVVNDILERVQYDDSEYGKLEQDIPLDKDDYGSGPIYTVEAMCHALDYAITTMPETKRSNDDEYKMNVSKRMIGTLNIYVNPHKQMEFVHGESSFNDLLSRTNGENILNSSSIKVRKGKGKGTGTVKSKK